MSGHNKWSQIKHKKAAVDSKRGKAFTKLIRQITVSAREGGGDPDANSALRLAIERARAANLPNDKIDLAIKRGTGTLEGVSYESLTYEGYGPGGVAVIAEVLTDNRNRTVAEIRHIFAKANGNLGQDGCVAWMFDSVGQLVISADLVPDEDDLMMVALDGGADDVVHDDNEFIVTCPPEKFMSLKRALGDGGFETLEQAEITRVAKNTVKLEGKEAQRVLKLVDTLEDNDDVQNVYANLELDAEVLRQLGA